MTTALITPTKDRPEQLNLVIDCINNQSVDADMWVIVDDGRAPVDKSILDKIRIPHKYIHWNSGVERSICANSAKCLEEVTADKYICIDDDDYYPCCYVENLSKALDKCGDNEIVGSVRWNDYRLSTGYYLVKFFHNWLVEWHSTGFKGERLKQRIVSDLKNSDGRRANDQIVYDEVVNKGGFKLNRIDFEDWGAMSLKDYGCGTPGFVAFHRKNGDMHRDDDNFTFFKNYLDEDWKRYEKYLGRLRDK